MRARAVGVPVGESDAEQGDKEPPHNRRGDVWGLRVAADF